MSRFKFSKGPWVVSEVEGVLWIEALREGVDNYDFTVAAVNYGTLEPINETNRPEIEANAKLIAAAPEMYELLKRQSMVLNLDEQWQIDKEIDELLKKINNV